MTAQAESIGVIAGSGRVPILVAEGIRRAGSSLVVVGLRGQADPALRAMADQFAWAGVVRVGRWIGLLRRHGVRRAVLVGGVKKADMYAPFRLLRYVPDFRALKLWYRTTRQDHRDSAILLAVADELASEGIELMSSVEYCQEHLAGEGLMTRTTVPAKAAGDVEFGFRIARRSAELDIGQSLAVKEGEIIAIEAIEGTDRMIARAGELCRTGGWTLVKVARPNQDMRFDVPTIGMETIRNLRAAGAVCVVLEAGKTLIVDKPDTLKLADEFGIAVLGRKV
ncbi:MAG TPA: UDP-2,3-diacylglucosamine diphosphatase LpxI [Phycisphaerae bacterium]|nr:UDP-2,3-diacylglucosamine diphosphatase LpxI [Phycisphaerae bacterium]HUU21564.1 UDP-2,3-diacylglucosamine diphosphatase LpxI [Phycisphaerae bacterium]